MSEWMEMEAREKIKSSIFKRALLEFEKAIPLAIDPTDAMGKMSPIEEVLGAAILAYGLVERVRGMDYQGCIMVDFDPISCPPPCLEPLGSVDYIWPQALVGKYRADFLIYRFVHPSGGVCRTPGIVIEADGHDFHEKTKEQAEHDKKRDRFLVESGLKLLRFSGSEIWRDAWECAAQINRILFAEENEMDRNSLRKVG